MSQENSTETQQITQTPDTDYKDELTAEIKNRKSVVDRVPAASSGGRQNRGSRYAKFWPFPSSQPVTQQRQITIPVAGIVMIIHFYPGNRY